MKDTIIQNLQSVLNALDNISVKGKANVLNLCGCISVTEQMILMLQDKNVTIETKEGISE